MKGRALRVSPAPRARSSAQDGDGRPATVAQITRAYRGSVDSACSQPVTTALQEISHRLSDGLDPLRKLNRHGRFQQFGLRLGRGRGKQRIAACLDIACLQVHAGHEYRCRRDISRSPRPGEWDERVDRFMMDSASVVLIQPGRHHDRRAPVQEMDNPFSPLRRFLWLYSRPAIHRHNLWSLVPELQTDRQAGLLIDPFLLRRERL